MPNRTSVVLETGWFCRKTNCLRDKYIKDTDWGYYSTTNGNCADCKKMCRNDSNCGGIECGLWPDSGHCIWWKEGKCQRVQEQSGDDPFAITCVKG